MARFVIVHGAWSGAHAWRWVRLKEETPWEGIGTQAEGLAAAFGRSTSFPLGPAFTLASDSLSDAP